MYSSRNYNCKYHRKTSANIRSQQYKANIAINCHKIHTYNIILNLERVRQHTCKSIMSKQYIHAKIKRIIHKSITVNKIQSIKQQPFHHKLSNNIDTIYNDKTEVISHESIQLNIYQKYCNNTHKLDNYV